MNIEDLTKEQKQELKDKGSVTIDGQRFRPEMTLEIEILDKGGNIKEVL